MFSLFWTDLEDVPALLQVAQDQRPYRVLKIRQKVSYAVWPSAECGASASVKALTAAEQVSNRARSRGILREESDEDIETEHNEHCWRYGLEQNSILRVACAVSV